MQLLYAKPCLANLFRVLQGSLKQGDKEIQVMDPLGIPQLGLQKTSKEVTVNTDKQKEKKKRSSPYGTYLNIGK